MNSRILSALALLLQFPISLHAEDLFANGPHLRILVKCELINDITAIRHPHGSKPTEIHWQEAKLWADLTSVDGKPPIHGYDFENVKPGEYALSVPIEIARKAPRVHIKLDRCLAFPYEGELIYELKDRETRMGVITLELKAERKFTRRISRHLRNKETGEALANQEISLMKVRREKGSAIQVEVATTDKNGFFQFLLWDDWEYSLRPKTAFADFGMANDPKREVISWLPENIFEEDRKK